MGIFVMLCGVAFFSYIMGNFIEIITNYDQKMGVIDHGKDLHNWLTMLSRFTNNKPLPRKLALKIEASFAYYWANDRLSIAPDDSFMSHLPRVIKRSIVTNYIYQDVFYKFRPFFNSADNRDSKFLYEVGFGLIPRDFCEEELIYDEEDEVPEMYFLLEGAVGVGFRLSGFGRQHRIVKHIREKSQICDHFVCEGLKSEFLFLAVKEIKAFALQRKYFKKLMKNYPKITDQIRKEARARYMKVVREPLLK